MYVTATHWTFKPGWCEDALDAAEHELMPVLEPLRGFLTLEVIRTDVNSILSIIHWHAEDDARDGLREIAGLRVEFLGSFLVGMDCMNGPVAYGGPAAPSGNFLSTGAREEVVHPAREGLG